MDLSISSTEEVVMPATKDEVDHLIESHTILIFSKTTCPYCKMAKQIFDKMQKKYTSIELNERDDGDEIQSILGEITGARTVPRVFVNGVCLGGGTDVKKLYEKGELQKMF
ncbi:Glutaredoxin-C4 [Melipona quadrifasciata]|uniref:Glutaredoxin-2, mitochondrial n=1 Tax=Melipona quadrifasciata TaxID=166423 RepID=A0A0M9A874_9HYME|nr:Glutaredoxin-C4 [Melipona quadrifasciata]